MARSRGIADLTTNYPAVAACGPLDVIWYGAVRYGAGAFGAVDAFRGSRYDDGAAKTLGPLLSMGADLAYSV